MEKKRKVSTELSDENNIDDAYVSPTVSSLPVSDAKSRNFVSYIVVFLLIVASFFIGSLTTKVQYLEKNGQAKPANVAANNPQVPQADPTVGEYPKVSNRDHIVGDQKARLTLIEYSDYECPFCKQFHTTMIQIMKDYAGKVNWVYRHYPLDFHANAQKEAEAAECVYELGGNDAFWKYTNDVYDRTTSNGTGFALDKLAPLAVEIGLSEKQFSDCLSSDRYAKYVTDDRDGGQKAGIQGTPGTIILDNKTGKTKLIPGALPYASVKPMLDEMLK